MAFPDRMGMVSARISVLRGTRMVAWMPVCPMYAHDDGRSESSIVVNDRDEDQMLLPARFDALMRQKYVVCGNNCPKGMECSARTGISTSVVEKSELRETCR